MITSKIPPAVSLAEPGQRPGFAAREDRQPGTTARAALRYFGGKWRLAPWIIRHFPPHTCYVEPFGGAASVLLRKPPARFEVYNDLDGEVVNFFRILREQPDALLHAIQLTPYSRAEVQLACRDPKNLAEGQAKLSPIEWARRFYVRAWQSIHGAPALGQMGWRYERANRRGWSRTVVDTWNATEHLLDIAARLKGVQLECDDALKVIARFDTPETLFYVDPPYVASTRGERWATTAYKHELDDPAHAKLAKTLQATQGLVVLSGFPGPLYVELYEAAGWHRVTCNALAQSAATTTEALWLSPAVWQQLRHRQLPLSGLEVQATA